MEKTFGRGGGKVTIENLDHQEVQSFWPSRVSTSPSEGVVLDHKLQMGEWMNQSIYVSDILVPSDQEVQDPEVLRISVLAYLRSMWTLFWACIRHPLTSIEIDLSTGKVVQPDNTGR